MKWLWDKDENGEDIISGIELASPKENIPNCPITVDFICRVRFGEGITVEQAMHGIEKALGSLDQWELQHLRKIILAPNKNGALINFVTDKKED